MKYRLFFTVLVATGAIVANVAQASYADLRIFYTWGPYYGSTLFGEQPIVKGITSEGAAPVPGSQVSAEQPLEGYVVSFADPEDGAIHYALGVPGQGLVEFDQAEGATLGVEPAQMVGQYVAVTGTVGTDAAGDSILHTTAVAPAPPPTDPLLAEAADATDQADLPALPDPGVSSGLFHFLEVRVMEPLVDAVTPGTAVEEALAHAAERAAEVSELATAGEASAVAVVAAELPAALADAGLDSASDEALRVFEKEVAGIMTVLEQQLPAVSEETQAVLTHAIGACQKEGLDAAADALNRPAVTAGATQLLQSGQVLGVITPAHAEAVFQADSRGEVRDVLGQLEDQGYFSAADVKGALDEAQMVTYPAEAAATTEYYKIKELARVETLQPSDDVKVKLEEFGKTYTPGAPVPPELAPFWVGAVRLEQLQATVRPDLIPKEALAAMQSSQPSLGAYYIALTERLKPAPTDIAALEQARAAARAQYTEAENIDVYLAPSLQRLAAFEKNLGVKPPVANAGAFFSDLAKQYAGRPLPFTGPGGCQTAEACSAAAARNPDSFKNFAPPSGYGTTQVNVAFKDAGSGATPPPVFPGFNGLGGYRPPAFAVQYSQFVPSGPTAKYEGPGGCQNAAQCIEKFKEIPPAERAAQFSVYTPTGTPAVPETFATGAPRPGVPFGSPTGPIGFPGPGGSGQPAPGFPHSGTAPGNYTSSGPGPASYYPSYAQPTSGGQNPPANYSPTGLQPNNPPPDGYQPLAPGGSYPAPPSGSSSDGQVAPPPGDGGGGAPPPSGGGGGEPAPPPSDGGGGGQPAPPPGP